MKRTLTFLTLLLTITFTFAQSNTRLSYQSVVRNAENQLVVQEEITVQFQLHNHSPLTAAIYTEQHTVRSNQNGLISLVVGEGTGQTGDIDAVTWNDAYICTQYSLAGEVVLADTQKINAVPYACYADRVPLSAIEEHLGSTALVTINMLQDSLSQYATHQEVQNDISLLVTRQELADSMAHTVSPEELATTTDTLVGRQELADSLSHYIQQGDLDNAVSPLVIRQELADSMSHTVSPEELAAATDTLVGRQEFADSLSHYVSEPELTNALQNTLDRDELADSLSHYATHGELDNAVGQLVSRQEFLDSLQQISNNGDLSALIQNLQNQINELQSLQETVDMFTVPSTPSNTFTLSFTPLPNHPVMMFINGVFISTQAISLSGNTLTYRYNYNGNKALAEGDRIQIYYSHN